MDELGAGDDLRARRHAAEQVLAAGPKLVSLKAAPDQVGASARSGASKSCWA